MKFILGMKIQSAKIIKQTLKIKLWEWGPKLIQTPCHHLLLLGLPKAASAGEGAGMTSAEVLKPDYSSLSTGPSGLSSRLHNQEARGSFHIHRDAVPWGDLLNWGQCHPMGDFWQCLETFRVVTIEGRSRWGYWNQEGWGQGCCWASRSAQNSPHNKGLTHPKWQQCQGRETLL